MIRPFLIAVQFLTRLPVSFSSMPEAAETSRSIFYYPLVGLIIGVVLSGSAWLFASLSPMLAAALLLCIWVLLTGGLHIDGLADSADAWAGGQGDRQGMLSIMKDPQSGPIGVTAVFLVLILKFAALVSLVENERFWLLIAAPFLGRVALLALFLTTAYVRPAGLGTPFAAGIPRNIAVPVTALSYVLVPVVFGVNGLWAVLAGLAAFIFLRAFMRRHLGGTTGDTAGALVELSETVVLISMALALSLSGP